MTLPLEREAIMPRLDGIRKNIVKLRELGELSFDAFKQGDPFDLAQHNLRLALEGVFHIGGHILSRIPGGRATEYKEIAKKLGKFGIVPNELVEKSLIPMAGLRNVLVHDYADLDAQKIYKIVKNHLGDIEEFLQAIKKLVENPGKFSLKIE